MRGKRDGKRARVAGGEGDDDGDGDGDGVGSAEGGATFVPLRRTAVPYTGDGAKGKAAREAERARSRLGKSRLLAELKASYSEAPEEDTIDGVGGGVGGDGARGKSRADAAAAEARERERTTHEEENFTRLTLTRADKAARRARERDSERWESLAELENFGDFEADTRAAAGGRGGDGGRDDDNDDEVDDGGDGAPPRSRKAGARGAATALERIEADVRARARLAASVGAAASTGMSARVGRKRTASAAAASLHLDDEDDERGGGGGWGQDEDGDGGGDGDDDDGPDPLLAAAAEAANERRAARTAARDAAAADRAAFYRARPTGDEATASGHRKASRQIIDNRGLVKYRKKEASNPRVAYRIKAEKKLKNRTGAAPTMRDGGAEADNYKGESTGIRANISKSRILRN